MAEQDSGTPDGNFLSRLRGEAVYRCEERAEAKEEVELKAIEGETEERVEAAPESKEYEIEEEGWAEEEEAESRREAAEEVCEAEEGNAPDVISPKLARNTGSQFMRRTVTLSILVAALLVILGGQPAEASTAHASVVGGVPAGGGYPFMAYISLEEAGDEGACSGTLVAANLVLTAAHCVVNETTGYIVEPEDMKVLIGTSNYLSGGRWYTAKSLYVDPSYRIGDLWHDAGLIELPGPVPAPTIALVERPVPARTGAWVLGWGLTEAADTEDSTPTTSELLIGQTVVQSATYCSRNAFPFYSASQLCSVDAPSYQSATCFGDSGGPMVVNAAGTPVEIGITSHNVAEAGQPECSTSTPRVDTRADVEAPWINRIAEEHEPTLPALTRSQAIHDVFNVLSTGPIRGHFDGRYQYGVRCERVESSKMKCSPEWGASGNDYYGTVTIYLVWEKGEPVWNNRYTIHWVNDYCYFNSGHRNSCRVGTARR